MKNDVMESSGDKKASLEARLVAWARQSLPDQARIYSKRGKVRLRLRGLSHKQEWPVLNKDMLLDFFATDDKVGARAYLTMTAALLK